MNNEFMKKKTDVITGKTMVKKVRIHAPIAVRTVNPIIQGDIAETYMSPANILKCLIARASVWEILSDGTLLRLNERNYNTVNKPKVTLPQKKQTLEKEVNKSAVNGESGYKTMVLKDNVALKEKVSVEAIADTIPGALEKINNDLVDNKVEKSSKVVDSKDAVVDDNSIKITSTFMSEDTTDTTDEDNGESEEVVEEPEMTDEEKELAALEAEIAKLEEEEYKNEES